MDADQIFRLVLLANMAVVLPIGIYHRLQSQASHETLDRRQEGLFILATLRPMGLVFLLGLIAYLVDPKSMAWSSMPVPAWLRWTGVALCAIADGLLTWTFRRLGKNLTDTVVTRREHTLVIDGPYQWVRHPFYVSAALLMLGVSLIAANWFLLVAGGIVVSLLIIRTRTEEEKLLSRFGDSYRRYMGRTGRFVPRIRAGRRGG